MSEKCEIKSLTFYFKYGASVKQCGQIAQLAQKEIHQAKISAGGMLPEDLEKGMYSKDAMVYEFGYCNHVWDDSGERCERCETIKKRIG